MGARRTRGRGCRAGDRRSRLALAATLTLLLAAAVVASAAPAQDDPPTLPPDPASATPDPYASCEEGGAASGAPPEGCPDTDQTPRYEEDTNLISHVAGAVFPTDSGADPDQLVPESPTSFDTVLYDVAFRNTRLGYAGGSVCAEEPSPQGTGESNEAFGRRVAACADAGGNPGDRVPVIYRYTDTALRGKVWEELYRSSAPGYVGAIAFTPAGIAVAVGGTGAYPRRELAPATPYDYEAWLGQDEQDGAGMGRSWELRGGRWGETTESLPAGARGMSALDFHPRENQDFGAAGALAQLIEWSEGGWAEVVDRNSSPGTETSNEGKIANRKLFRYRVREIHFVDLQAPLAIAVTAGCCAADDLRDKPAILGYDGQQRRWFVSSPGADHLKSAESNEEGTSAEAARLDTRPYVPDSIYSFLVRNTGFGGGDLSVAGVYTAGGGEREDEPPSILGTDCRRVGRADGGSPGDSNFLSFNTARLTAPNSYTGRDQQTLAGTRLHSARLLSVDGDAGVNWSTYRQRAGTASNDLSPVCDPKKAHGLEGDGYPDWMVGELRSTRLAGLGARGLAIATHMHPAIFGETLNVDTSGEDKAGDISGEFQFGKLSQGNTPNNPFREPTVEELAGAQWRPTDEERLLNYVRSREFLLPSYTVNALDMVGASGQGWLVGDHGAILKITEQEQGGGGGGSVAEPEPPRLHPGAGRQLPDTAPFDGMSPPPSGAPGEVPSLAVRPLERLPRGELRWAGSPLPDQTFKDPVEDASEIVMSRDGNEGWAIGPSWLTAKAQSRGLGAMPTLWHYDGATWGRCDPDGIEGQLAPDAACEDLARFRSFFRTGGTNELTSVKLVAAARVPFENDGDPANDDEFEVVAVGTPYQETQSDSPDQLTVVRYRDGRWSLDPLESRQGLVESIGDGARSPVALAFTAPDDGWLLTSPGGQQNPGTSPIFFHWDGSTWTRCQGDTAAHAAECGDLPGADGRLWQSTVTGDPSRSLAQATGIEVAGRRAYIFGQRALCGTTYPVLLYRDPGGRWTDGSGGKGGGLDPGFGRQCNETGPAEGVEKIADSGDPTEPLKNDADIHGTVASLAIVKRDDGYEGWAVGQFTRGGATVDLNRVSNGAGTFTPGAENSALLRLRAGESEWEPFVDGGPLDELLGVRVAERRTMPALQAIVPSGSGDSEAFIGQRQSQNVFRFEPRRQRWELIETEREAGSGQPRGLAPDGQGGVWLSIAAGPPDDVVEGGRFGTDTFFARFSDRHPRPVFAEVPHPLRDGGARVTALGGAPDGTVWAATNEGRLARYDRVAGWQMMRIPGWDPGRVITRSSEVHALAVGRDGTGVAVGRGGRIADFDPTRVSLDGASGRLCSTGELIVPCGTSRDLRAVAVAPDGSAVAGGDRMALLWRPAGDGFRAIAKPEAAPTSTITGLSMPSADRAYLATDSGLVFRGDRDGEAWSWTFENVNELGDQLSLDVARNPLALRAVAVDEHGHGYAVGDEGLILERRGDGAHPWKRMRTPFLDDLRSVTLPAGGGEGALIGGRRGLILTLSGGRFHVARPADYTASNASDRGSGDGTSDDPTRTPPSTPPVVDLALLPGTEPGQAEAWAAIPEHGAGTNRILHYSSDPDDPLLEPAARARALPDAPAPREGELAFAALGKTECHQPPEGGCGPMSGALSDFEVLARRTVEAVNERAGRPGGPRFSLFTGDALESGGKVSVDAGPYLAAAAYRRWNDFVSSPLTDGGRPFFPAIGAQDLREERVDEWILLGGQNFFSSRDNLETGDNIDWRTGMSGLRLPRGRAEMLAKADGLRFEALADRDGATRHEDRPVETDFNEGGSGTVVNPGGASTHYAVDVVAEDGTKWARIVAVDNSARSLNVNDPIQQPLERDGQRAFLEEMLCFEGEQAPTGGHCTRGRDQRAIVLASTPTYSYGAGYGTDTAADATVLEALLIKYRVSVVVSGRLGWNGRYWATAPGIHEPCPGEGYRDAAPSPGTRVCGRSVGGLPVDPGSQVPAAKPVIDPVNGAVGQPPLPDEIKELTGGIGEEGVLPFVIASGAAGSLGPDTRTPEGSASEGYWHGYTIVRVAPDGDPRALMVEQRPVLDWVSLDASANVLRPGGKMALNGFGREPIAFTSENGLLWPLYARFDDIGSPAITHRYELLVADPQKPWLPLEAPDNGIRSEASERLGEDDPCGPYLCLDPKVATIDDQSGEVKAGKGNYSRTFAIAQLSVGEQTATYPLVFEPRASFRAPAPPPPAAVAVPPPPPPPAPAQPTTPQVNLPAAPVLPVLTAQALAPPPVPPSPPVVSSEAPLDLNLSPAALDVSPPTAVSQPPTPPVNPAPPSGARREARQRQAAAQKSGADSDQEGSEAQDLGGDLANDAPGASGSSMTRHDFTAIASRQQPSAWARDLLLGGGLGIAALILALGLRTARPTPRRRRPELPAPAWSWQRRDR